MSLKQLDFDSEVTEKETYETYRMTKQDILQDDTFGDEMQATSTGRSKICFTNYYHSNHNLTILCH